MIESPIHWENSQNVHKMFTLCSLHVWVRLGIL